MIHTYASLRHYAEHLTPIYDELPPQLQGGRWAPRSTASWGTVVPHPRLQPPGPVMVASLADARRFQHRPVIYVEHGAGQAYPGDERSADHGSYSGGEGLDHVALFICPSERVARRWAARYGAPTAVVGCPKLDRWHRDIGPNRFRPDDTPLVAVTFHWDCGLIPETRSAYEHFAPALADLRDLVRAAGGELIGHGHPRQWQRYSRMWADLGVPHTPKLADVLDQAWMLVADNTSAMYEFASLDRPVIALNAPWYRRDVEHGLRFWSHVPGLQVDEPADLVDAAIEAASDHAELRRLRRAAVAEVYAAADGRAAERAADAILEVVRAQPEGAADLPLRS